MSNGKEQYQSFGVCCGVRRGSIILSLMLFNFYMNEMQLQLNSCKSGRECHIGNTPLINIAYADDVVIVSPSGLSKRFEDFA